MTRLRHYMDHNRLLQKWSNYLGVNQTLYIINYLDVIKTGARQRPPRFNDKILLILGDENTGKSELFRDMVDYIGSSNNIYHRFDIDERDPAYRSDVIEWLNASGVEEVRDGISVISTLNSLDRIREGLLPHCHIIQLTHRFSRNPITHSMQSDVLRTMQGASGRL